LLLLFFVSVSKSGCRSIRFFSGKLSGVTNEVRDMEKEKAITMDITEQEWQVL